jgi:hypothetical protein
MNCNNFSVIILRSAQNYLTHRFAKRSKHLILRRIKRFLCVKREAGGLRREA